MYYYYINYNIGFAFDKFVIKQNSLMQKYLFCLLKYICNENLLLQKLIFYIRILLKSSDFFFSTIQQLLVKSK